MSCGNGKFFSHSAFVAHFHIRLLSWNFCSADDLVLLSLLEKSFSWKKMKLRSGGELHHWFRRANLIKRIAPALHSAPIDCEIQIRRQTFARELKGNGNSPPARSSRKGLFCFRFCCCFIAPRFPHWNRARIIFQFVSSAEEKLKGIARDYFAASFVTSSDASSSCSRMLQS